MKRIIRQTLRHRVIVTLKSGAAFGGVLYEADSEAIELWETSILEVNGTDRRPIPADGKIVIFRAEVEYIQVP